MRHGTRNTACWIGALLVSCLLAGSVMAQSTASSSEFGRASGGELSLITKHAGRLSGTLGISSGSDLLFGSGGRRGYEASLGGTVVEDRIWFFASAQQSDALFGTRLAAPLPQNAGSQDAVSRAIDAKLAMQLGNRQNLAATFATTRGAEPLAVLSNPASFLSLHYTGIVSDHMFFTTSFSRSSVAQPQP